MSHTLTTRLSSQLVHNEKGLFLHYGNKVHRVKEIVQGIDFLSIVYYIEGSLDLVTEKPVTKTLIISGEDKQDGSN